MFPPLQREGTSWTLYALIALGLWLIVAPATFGYSSRWICGSDILCGLLIIILSLKLLGRQEMWPYWAICFIGIWLELAPLLFWAKEGAAYLNDTLSGVLAMALAILIPGLPVERTKNHNGSEIPPGWSYNPSSWLQRIPIIFLGFIGWMTARYMAAYQLGYIHTMWDPLFGDGTLKVITSSVSQSFPISDAGFGAFAYTLEALMGCKGSERRWHTMPWIVIFFGILVIPLGLTSITLIILQPLLVGYWCCWCLLTAVCMLVMVALTIDEVVAVLQYLHHVRKSGQPFWQVFWHGGDAPDATADLRSPPVESCISKTWHAMTWGIGVPWNLLVTAALGAWLMFEVPLVGVTGNSADNYHIAGALIITLSVVAMAEVVRSARFIITLFGLWFLASAYFFDNGTQVAMWNDIIVGIALVAFSFPRGNIVERYGSWSSYIA